MVVWSVDCSYCLRISTTFTALPKNAQKTMKQFFLFLISNRRFAYSSKTFFIIHHMDWLDAAWFMRSSFKYILIYASSPSYSYDTRSTSWWMINICNERKQTKTHIVSIIICVFIWKRTAFQFPTLSAFVISWIVIWHLKFAKKKYVKNGTQSHSAQNHT